MTLQPAARRVRLMGMRALLLVALLSSTACSGADVVATDPPPATSLVVETDATTWQLTCEPAGGTHPEPEAACRQLAEQQNPFAPIPEDAVCTEQYGGPETAHVRGTYRGEPVDLELSRINGCYISQWDSLVPLVPPA